MNSRSRNRWWVVGGGNASDTSDCLRMDSGGDMRWLGLIVALSLFGVTEAKAQVVALGPSSTRGYLLPLTDAWPAKLEALLRQHGANLSVANEGINGDTSDGMLSRLDSAVPNGTRVVVFTCCGNDNKDANHVVADRDGNIKTIVSRLRARRIAVVFIGERFHGEGEPRRRAKGGSVMVRVGLPRRRSGRPRGFASRSPPDSERP